MAYKTEVVKEWHGREVEILGKKYIGESVFEGGLVIEGQAKLLCAVDTGRLAASITTQSRDNGTVPTGKGAVMTDVIDSPGVWNQAYVGTPVEYGPWLEFGTNRSAAQAFLRPALALARGEAVVLIEQKGKIVFRDYMREAP